MKKIQIVYKMVYVLCNVYTSMYILLYKGNCCLRKNDVEKAKELYIIALENDASCVEALYNLR